MRLLKGVHPIIEKIVLVIMAIFWVLTTFLAVWALSEPPEINESIKVDSVTHIISFDYETRELPESITSLSGAIFTKTQNDMKIKVNSTVKSNKLTTVKGSYDIYLILTAEELWEKAIPLVNEKSFYLSGNENIIAEDEIIIDFKYWFDEIDRISNDVVGARSARYTLAIEPRFNGEVVYGNNTFPLEQLRQIAFNVTNDQVTIIGEKLFNDDIPIFEIQKQINKMNLLGLRLQIMFAKYFFSIVSCFSLFAIIMYVLMSIKKVPQETITEAGTIDKNYKARLTPIQQQITISNKAYLALSSFKSLIRVADEKDRSILRYESETEGIVIYYLLEGDYVYNYYADNCKRNIVSNSSKGVGVADAT